MDPPNAVHITAVLEAWTYWSLIQVFGFTSLPKIKYSTLSNSETNYGGCRGREGIAWLQLRLRWATDMVFSPSVMHTLRTTMWCNRSKNKRFTKHRQFIVGLFIHIHTAAGTDTLTASTTLAKRLGPAQASDKDWVDIPGLSGASECRSMSPHPPAGEWPFWYPWGGDFPLYEWGCTHGVHLL